MTDNPNDCCGSSPPKDEPNTPGNVTPIHPVAVEASAQGATGFASSAYIPPVIRPDERLTVAMFPLSGVQLFLMGEPQMIASYFAQVKGETKHVYVKAETVGNDPQSTSHIWLPLDNLPLLSSGPLHKEFWKTAKQIEMQNKMAAAKQGALPKLVTPH
jgi:hypothetical protein